MGLLRGVWRPSSRGIVIRAVCVPSARAQEQDAMRMCINDSRVAHWRCKASREISFSVLSGEHTCVDPIPVNCVRVGFTPGALPLQVWKPHVCKASCVYADIASERCGVGESVFTTQKQPDHLQNHLWMIGLFFSNCKPMCDSMLYQKSLIPSFAES